MKFEIISIWNKMMAVACVVAKNKEDALNVYAEDCGMKYGRSAWFELRHTYIAAPLGENNKCRQLADEMIKEMEKHIYVPKTAHELYVLTGVK